MNTATGLTQIVDMAQLVVNHDINRTYVQTGFSQSFGEYFPMFDIFADFSPTIAGDLASPIA